MRHLFPSLFITLFFLCALGCVSKPIKTITESTDTNGNLIVANHSGFELAFYVDKEYKTAAKSEERLSILVDYAENAGTIVVVDLFYRDRLDNVEIYPANNEAMYCSFPKIVYPVGSPEKVIPILIPQFNQEELASNTGVGNVLVRFSYNDDPQLLSAATVFTGSSLNRKNIALLENGNTIVCALPAGLNQINIEYRLSGSSGIQRKTYPQTLTQRNDDRFLVYVTSDAQKVSYMIPKISDIFKISYASDSGVARGNAPEIIVSPAGDAEFTIGDPILP